MTPLSPRALRPTGGAPGGRGPLPAPRLGAALILCAVGLLAGCLPPGTGPDAPARGLVGVRSADPARDGAGCFARDVAPAVVETVTEQRLLRPAERAADGRILRPAVYRTERVQRILRPRQELWFETPCEEDLTPDFIASLQRALAVRGFYHGPITGAADAATRRALRAYQRRNGLDSAVLSLAAARQLGLVPVGAEEAPADFDPDPTDLPG